MANIDLKNQQILQELARNGRISNLELADRVGLSPSACLRRVQELERSGIISGYRALLNPAAMGVGFVAYIGVGLGEHTKTAQEGFEKAVQLAPEVVECHNIAGNAEYLLRVEVSSLEAYKNFHAEVLGVQPQVTQVTSYFRLSTSKDKRNFLEQDTGKA